MPLRSFLFLIRRLFKFSRAITVHVSKVSHYLHGKDIYQQLQGMDFDGVTYAKSCPRICALKAHHYLKSCYSHNLESNPFEDEGDLNEYLEQRFGKIILSEDFHISSKKVSSIQCHELIIKNDMRCYKFFEQILKQWIANEQGFRHSFDSNILRREDEIDEAEIFVFLETIIRGFVHDKIEERIERNHQYVDIHRPDGMMASLSIRGPDKIKGPDRHELYPPSLELIPWLFSHQVLVPNQGNYIGLQLKAVQFRMNYNTPQIEDFLDHQIMAQRRTQIRMNSQARFSFKFTFLVNLESHMQYNMIVNKNPCSSQRISRVLTPNEQLQTFTTPPFKPFPVLYSSREAMDLEVKIEDQNQVIFSWKFLLMPYFPQ